ncbi:auxilin-like clathrin-binding protein required for normal clathrin function [Coemansia asiatica]|uniref:Auxilin-like clathrin-binding protein required for normal clathrin function n=1 Tax=Coemansia asiatica TaxID=1052880 RepID=A0A9W7XH01_9FUNG|nr:auxilin-like clathrin-binding protein required for normal clathrin function [Coemansia asiatica]
MDDFAGLSWSSNGSQNNNQRSNGNSASQSSSALRAATTASRPNYSPGMLSASGMMSFNSSAGNGSGGAAAGKQAAKDDPFGELVSFSSSQSSQPKMTLRERQQMLDEQSRSRSGSPFASNQQQQQQQQKDAWNFDVLEKAGASRSGTGTPVMQQRTQMPGTSSSSSGVFNAIDFDPLSTESGTQKQKQKQSSALGSTTTSNINNSIGSGRLGSADLLDDDEPIPMDITTPPPAQASRLDPRANRNSNNGMQPQQTGSSSEPFVDKDFEIAQIAGYGYTAEQAKTALEITGNTRAAIQLLRDQQSAAQQMPRHEKQQEKPAQSRSSQRQDTLQTSYRDDSSDDDTGFSYCDDRAQSERTGGGPQFGSLFGNKGGADALLASANELGTNMWKQANTWFSMGKKKIIEMQETVLEQRRPGSNASGGRAWRDEDYLPSKQPYRDDSSSDDDDDEMYVSAYRRGQQQKQQPYQEQPKTDRTDRMASSYGVNRSAEKRPGLGGNGGQQQADHLSFSFSSSSRAAESLMGMDGEPAGTFAFEQARGRHISVSSRLSASTAAEKASSTPPPAQVPALAPHVIQSAHAAKTKANEQFKLGQFGEAIAGYTQSISHVVRSSDSHPFLIVLYNNRALACARNGESKNALGDCTLALDLCMRFQGNQTVDLGMEAGRVDVQDQRAKALQRRGEAYEAGEKYREALADWKTLRETARDNGMRQQAARGIQRCEKALGINQPAKQAAAKKPAAEQRPEDIANLFASISIDSVKNKATMFDKQTESSAAVAEMRRNEEARRVEDDQRLAILDQVDAEIRRWRDGKQQNLRALLSSLHMLLPEFPPIGMHEILEPNKVKRAYMRAIAKLHPDKLSKDIDVRTKMISSNVFSSLNEAWDAFKAQEGVS